MIHRPINRQKYPYTARKTGFGWGVLNTAAETPYIVDEFETEDMAWSHIKSLNESYWVAFEAQRMTYWAIAKAAEDSSNHVSVSSILKAFLQVFVILKKVF